MIEVIQNYGFDDSFQDLVLACIIGKADEFLYALNFIKPEYFNGKAAFDTANEIYEYWIKYDRLPGFVVLANLCHDRFVRENPDHAQALYDYVSKLHELDTGEWQPIKERCQAFAKERALQVVIKKLIVSTTEGKTFKGDPVKLVEAAVQVGDDMGDMGIELHRDIEYVVEKLSDTTRGLRTGYPLLDRVWPLGWQPGWLICILAPPKRYKTSFCIQLALNMAGPESGSSADVLYYACEIDQIHAMKRALMNLTGTTEQAMLSAPGRFIDLAHDKTEIIHGNILFKSFPSRAATIQDIRSHAKQSISTFGMKPKAIFIDYAETVRPSTWNDRTRRSDEKSADVFHEARALGADLKCVVIMPDRCKAEVVDKPVPSLNSFQGSFQKDGIVDAAIGLCCTDSEKKQGRMRYFVFINRHGHEFGYFDGKVYPEIAQMTITGELTFSEEEADEQERRDKFRRGNKKRIKPSTVTDDDVRFND